MWRPEDDDNGEYRQDDVESIFGFNSEAMVPDCSPYYPDSARVFRCLEPGVWWEFK